MGYFKQLYLALLGKEVWRHDPRVTEHWKQSNDVIALVRQALANKDALLIAAKEIEQAKSYSAMLEAELLYTVEELKEGNAEQVIQRLEPLLKGTLH